MIEAAGRHAPTESRRPWRLVFLSTGLNTGGAEMMLLKLVGALPSENFDCAVVSLRDQGTIGPRLTELGVPVDSCGLHERWWRLPVTLPRAGVRLARLKPDLLIGWMYHGNLAATMAGALLPHAKVLWSIRQTLYSLYDERLRTRLIIRAGARLATRPEVIIYNSAVSVRQHRSFGYRARRDVVIPNGFDCEAFRPRPEAGAALRDRLGIPKGAPLIGLVARYHRMKGHATFLRMAGRLVASGSGAHFICAGLGVDPRNPELTAGIAANALTERVHLLGEQRDTPALLAGLDLLCSSSESGEGFSNVLGEAMACGVPCVVTDVGDSALIVGTTGIVTASGDDTALAAGCAQLLAESPVEHARRGAAARSRIVEEFSLAAVAGRYAAVFREVLGGLAGPLSMRQAD